MSATAIQPQTTRTLTAEDRCDRCGAQAYLAIRVKPTLLELLFCAHHAREHEAKIQEVAADILDETEKLLDPGVQTQEDVV